MIYCSTSRNRSDTKPKVILAAVARVGVQGLGFKGCKGWGLRPGAGVSKIPLPEYSQYIPNFPGPLMQNARLSGLGVGGCLTYYGEGIVLPYTL